MLTINADTHPLMRQFHKPDDEKRMVVILDESVFDAWLESSPAERPSFFKPFPAVNPVASVAQQTLL